VTRECSDFIVRSQALKGHLVCIQHISVCFISVCFISIFLLTLADQDVVCLNVADFFLEHGEHEKGVQLLMQARQFSRALDVCQHHNVAITEVSLLSEACSHQN